MAVSVLLLLVVLTASLSPAVLSARDSRGTEFILGFMENVLQHDPVLYISTSSSTPVDVSVTIPLLDPGWGMDITVSSGEEESVKLPYEIRANGNEKSNKGVWIRSTEEVTVHALSLEEASTDPYLAFPVDTLGQEYYAVTSVSHGTILVVATEDNTEVSIKFSSSVQDMPWNKPLSIGFGGTTYRNGDTLTLNLNKFETIQVGMDDELSFYDLTGTCITSNKPIAVVSGNKAYKISKWSQHLMEMLMPVDVWGETFITIGPPDRTKGDLYYIMASENDTQVDIAGHESYSLASAGDIQFVYLPVEAHIQITSNKPIMVAMFNIKDSIHGLSDGITAMTVLAPDSQYISDYTWSSVPSLGEQFTDMVIVIIEDKEKSGLQLDGENVNWAEENPVENSSKVQLWTSVTRGPHHLYHLDQSVTFNAFAYGTRGFDSYGFNVGMRLDRINAACTPSCTLPGDDVDNDCDGSVDEEAFNGRDDDGDGSIDEDLALPPPVDGQWGSWNPWGSCSVTCGKHGLKIRTRACDDPAPANNGAFCPDSCAEAAHCHSEPCPGRVREDKTCQLSYGDVDTFGGVSGIFYYRCLFKAAKLGPFKVAGGHKLELDIYAACKDANSEGYIFVSEVNIVVWEISLHPSPRTSRFSINSQQINNVVSGMTQTENPEDLWTVEDRDGYKDYLCFGYEDGQVSFSVKKSKKSACTQVLTFRPLIPDARKSPNLVITVKEHQLSNHHSVRFPNSICSGRQDEAFKRPFKGLETTEQKILYALLDQNVEQPESDPQCSDAVRAFQQSSEDGKKKAVEQCESVNLEDLAACIIDASQPSTETSFELVPFQ